MNKIAVVLVIITLWGTEAFAGKISGHVKYSDDSDCSECRVSALITSVGITGPIYTDSEGYFTLRWSSDNLLDKLFVNGKAVLRNIQPNTDKILNIKIEK